MTRAVREPNTLGEWGIAIGILLGPERSRRFADLLLDAIRGKECHQLADGLLFSAAQDDARCHR